MAANPFKPTAGKNPPALIGRDYVLEEFSEGIENGPGAPNRLMRITGMRGMGKTVMLNAIGDVARRLGWRVVDETANQGFCDRIFAALTSGGHVSHLTAAPSLFGVSLGGVDIDTASLSLRDAMKRAAQKSDGLLVTLDEVQDASLDEMRALSVAVQHLIREDANIAFVFAGLPSMVESIVNGKTLTFLRRAVPVELGPIGQIEVAQSLADTMRSSGIDADGLMCDRLAKAAGGYPFMVQLVGYHVWQEAHHSGLSAVSEVTVDRGIALARERFDQMVIEPALQRLPESCLEYLLAMSLDGNSLSSSGEVAKRLGKTAQQVATVRARLIREDVIEAVSWGKVSFAIPYMADYLNARREELSAEVGHF